jgi:acyl-CoA thioesterase
MTSAGTSEWDRHLSLEPTGEGRYAGALDPGWSVGGGINGGFQLALAGAAVSAHLPEKPDPVAVSAYYLSAGTPGPAEVAVDVRRDGGRLATVSAELAQEGQTRLTLLATYADLDRFHGDVRTTAVEPELPPREECSGPEDVPDFVLELAPMMGRFEMRFPVEQTGWVRGEPRGEGHLSAWFRFRDDRPVDPVALLMVLDALPPVTFDLGLVGWAPTLELTCHVRAKPAPGWLKVQHRTRNFAGGMFEEDCEVWDSTGRLVAQSRQLALAPRVD